MGNTCKTRKNKNKLLKKSDSSTVQQLLNNVYLFGEEDFLYFYSNLTHLNNNLSNQFNYRVAPIFREYNPNMLDFMNNILMKNKKNMNNEETENIETTELEVNNQSDHESIHESSIVTSDRNVLKPRTRLSFNENIDTQLKHRQRESAREEKPRLRKTWTS